MGKPRFKPSHVFANPRHFGRTLHGQWAKPNPLNPTETAWAIFQHRAAHTALTTLQQNNQTLETFATTLNQDLAWLKRNLYGQTPAALGDIMNWTLTLGIDILPVFDNLAELQGHTEKQRN